jgi:hypothetical protein
MKSLNKFPLLRSVIIDLLFDNSCGHLLQKAERFAATNFTEEQLSAVEGHLGTLSPEQRTDLAVASPDEICEFTTPDVERVLNGIFDNL